MDVDARRAWDTPIYEAACVIARHTRSAEAPRPLQLSVGECRIAIEPLDDGVAPWTARAPMPGDTSIDKALWHGTLLSANIGLMRHGCIAFGLDDEGRAMLMGQLIAEPGTPTAAAQQLQCLYDVWRLAQGLRHAPLRAALASWGLAGYLIPPHRENEQQQRTRHMRAVRCLSDGLERMGLPPAQASRIAAARRLRRADTDIRFAAARNGHSLLLYIRLRDARLDGTPDAALRWTGRLMSELGIAVGRGLGGRHQLMAHWPFDSRGRRDFDSYLSAFMELPAALRGDGL